MPRQEVGHISYYQNVDAGILWQMVPKHWEFFPDDKEYIASFHGREGRVIGCSPAIGEKGVEGVLFTYGDDSILEIHPTRLEVGE